ncbi:MAG TPA: erythromycin esterase family protein [Chthonomonadaceae bacterium]|nr:erythromycin esterase family protein [Chthonomonadaceae bacterium]
MRTIRAADSGAAAPENEIATQCRDAARPLRAPRDLDPLMEQIGDARCVLLGEASHGTSEYYVWRTWLTQRLIREKGFSFIAVEGDWPDCYRVNRFVKGYPDAGATARDVLAEFRRWPTWMWANWEIVALAEWLRDWNAGRPESDRAGFYGLDVYSLWDSMDAVMRYLERVDGAALEAARRAFRCFEPYGDDGQDYARSTVALIPESCEEDAVAMLAALRREQPDPRQDGREAFFVAEQNALIVKNAETYYRAMVRGGPHSWNVRDRHMVETLDRLMRFHGPQAKAVVWEHNTHVGDACATGMAADGMVNVGQLVREARAPGEWFVVGFGSYRGSVIAGRQWGAPMERMPVPEARAGSWEDLLHRAGPTDKLLLMDELRRRSGDHEPHGHIGADRRADGGPASEHVTRTAQRRTGAESAGERSASQAAHHNGGAASGRPLPASRCQLPVSEPRGHRAIGVVYQPAFEQWGNYVPTVLPDRYDAFLYIDETHALHPLHIQPSADAEPPETYPWNV